MARPACCSATHIVGELAIGPSGGYDPEISMRRNSSLVDLGDQIRILRRKSGWSQEAVAYRAGLDRTYFAGVERGERNPGVLNVVRIAEALSVEVGCLFERVERRK